MAEKITPSPSGYSERKAVEARAKQWWRDNMPRCLSYPKCDGDLPGESHVVDCPCHKNNILKPYEVMADFALAESEAEVARFRTLLINLVQEIKAIMRGEHGADWADDFFVLYRAIEVAEYVLNPAKGNGE